MAAPRNRFRLASLLFHLGGSLIIGATLLFLVLTADDFSELDEYLWLNVLPFVGLGLGFVAMGVFMTALRLREERDDLDDVLARAKRPDIGDPDAFDLRSRN